MTAKHESLFRDSIKVGDQSNYSDISDDGIITFAGTAQRWIQFRPAIRAGKVAGAGKPTAVSFGANSGYSMPVYNNDDEEIFVVSRVPFRWNGTDNPIFAIMIMLGGAEDVDDNFKFQLSWTNSACVGCGTASTRDVPIEQTIITGRNSQYCTYCLYFEVDYDDSPNTTLLAGDNISGRLQRIDATNPDVANEIIVVDWVIIYPIDKLGADECD